MEVDWQIVTKIAGLGFLVLFIVVGALAIIVWAVNLIVRKTFPQKASNPPSNQS